MDSVTVTIRRIVDDEFPGVVECSLVDSNGCEHWFLEKVPVVSAADLSSDSVFPQAGHIACVVQEEWRDEGGRALVRVGTDAPWGVESVTGETNFTLLREQVTGDIDQAHMLLCAAGNTEVPAYLVLGHKGYTVRHGQQAPESKCWYAEKDHLGFRADTLIALLGLVCMYESRGVDWAATDLDIDDFLSKHGA